MNEPTMEELQAEFAEFKATSQALEAELEAELAETEEKTLELERQLSEAHQDIDYWRQRAERGAQDAARAQQQLAEQTEALKQVSQRTQKRLVAAERDNDDMERSGREAHASARELAQQNADLLEQLAIAQAEARDRTTLNEELHRARDDLRDAHDEISRLQTQNHQSNGHQRSDSLMSGSSQFPRSQSLRRVAGMLDQVAVLEGRISTVRKRFGSDGSTRVAANGIHVSVKQPLDLRSAATVGHGKPLRTVSAKYL